MPDAPSDDRLLEALSSSQALGMLGGRPVTEVVEHSRRFCDALADVRGRVVDLGSGGGVPGLVVAWDRPDLQVVLVDRRAGRTDHLRRVLVRLGIDDRVSVLALDVDLLTRRSPGEFDGVTARGFGPPEATARAGLALAKRGAPVVISEPPAGNRWDESTLSRLHATLERRPGVAVLRRATPS